MKKAFNIAANVCAIVLMSLILLGAIYTMSNLVGSKVKDADLILIGCIFLLLFSVATIIVASLALAKGNRAETKVSRGLKITVAVLVGIITLLLFIGGNEAGFAYGFIFLIPLGLEITSICVRNPKNPEQNDAAQSPALETVDSKIAELKKLKSLHVISDEQYENAITEIINEVK